MPSGTSALRAVQKKHQDDQHQHRDLFAQRAQEAVLHAARQLGTIVDGDQLGAGGQAAARAVEHPLDRGDHGGDVGAAAGDDDAADGGNEAAEVGHARRHPARDAHARDVRQSRRAGGREAARGQAATRPRRRCRTPRRSVRRARSSTTSEKATPASRSRSGCASMSSSSTSPPSDATSATPGTRRAPGEAPRPETGAGAAATAARTD